MRAMTIDTSQKVGIGTAAPKGILQINATDAPLIIGRNTSVIPCNATFEGGIIYTDRNKHWGCDGSVWNAFY